MCQGIKVSDLSPPKIFKLNAVSNKVAANAIICETLNN